MAVKYGKKTKFEPTPEQKLRIRQENIARYRKSIGKRDVNAPKIQGTGLDSLKKYIPSIKATPQKKVGSAEDAVAGLRKNRNRLPRKGF